MAKHLIDEEEQKGHHLLARDLKRIIQNGHGAEAARKKYEDVPVDKEDGLPLADIQTPEFTWNRVVLNPQLQEKLKQISKEYRKRDVLRTYGLGAKDKVLFFGPPGCGKTISAKVMAGVLNLPLLYVRFDSLISSYLGATASNLRKLFDYATRGRWVILFDEFDAIGKGRDNSYEHGELKRVVNTLLQLMDGFKGDSLIIAATNHEFLLDPALWRRFDEICYFAVPTEKERVMLMEHFLSSFAYETVDVEEMARDLDGMTGSDIERICLDAVKRAILDGRDEISNRDLKYGKRKQADRKNLAGKKNRINPSERG